jgi:hypothetical protein
MEPHREERQKALPSAEPKPKRFRIVKLEERIAPNKGGGGHTSAPQCGPIRTAAPPCQYTATVCVGPCW